MVSLSQNQQIGILLTCLGLLFTTFGILLLFDRGLLAIGNLLFLSGVTLVIGFQKTIRFFFQRRKLKGSIPFLGGIVLVLFGRTFTGMIVEVFGFINLFGDFFPIVVAFLRRVPVVGNILEMPGIRHVTDKICSSRSLPV